MKYLAIILLFQLVWPFLAFSQSAENRGYASVFQLAYQACPDIPRGLLEAVAFTNTHCNHLTDGDYFHDGPDAMPRAYGLMGLVKDGKSYFRENLHLVSELSGISEKEILESPAANVKAYALAFDRLAKEGKALEMKDYLSVIQQLSELPIGEGKDVFPMQSMVYSVCAFLNDAEQSESFGFQKYELDLKALFGKEFERLSAPAIRSTSGGDYSEAIWDPAPECNFSERNSEVKAVVIHDTEGSYAGCISWFKNCAVQVSAHYVIRSVDGQVTQLVRESEKAWHARTANPYTIGIEHEGYVSNPSYYTKAMYQSSANLVRDICSRYESIDGHRTFYRDTLDNGQCLSSGVHDLGGENACTKIRGHQHYPDQSHTDPGPYWDWNYYYKLINEGTSVTLLEGEEGRLDHRNYGDDERKIWVIKVPQGASAQLDFSSFKLERDYDFLWIYDGDDVFAPKIGRWNTKTPGVVKASSNVMCVEFRSDCATSEAGWEAAWKAVWPTPPEPEMPEIEAGVFPNPTSGKFTIKSDSEGFTDAVIFDVHGVEMLRARFIGSFEIDASGWDSGVYVVNYGSPAKMGKIIKLVKL